MHLITKYDNIMTLRRIADMLNPCKPFDNVDLVIKRLQKGVFLLSADENGKTNAMAMSWGFIGIQWSKPIFIAPVRLERYTYGLIKKMGSFVVCVQPEDMDDDMFYCGSKSGRDEDKLEKLGLKTIPLPNGKIPALERSLFVFECDVIHETSAAPHTSHTFFYGEIKGAYRDASLER